jgi:hypothetical protein
VKPGTVILHARADDVVPFADSEELVHSSGLPASALVEVGDDHRLADPEPLRKMLEACEGATGGPTKRESCGGKWRNRKSLPKSCTPLGAGKAGMAHESLKRCTLASTPTLVCMALIATQVATFYNKERRGEWGSCKKARKNRDS